MSVSTAARRRNCRHVERVPNSSFTVFQREPVGQGGLVISQGNTHGQRERHREEITAESAGRKRRSAQVTRKILLRWLH